MSKEDIYREIDLELDRDPFSIVFRSKLNPEQIKVVFDKYVELGHLDAVQYISEEIYYNSYLEEDTLQLLFSNSLKNGDKYTATRVYNLIELHEEVCRLA